MKVSEGFWGDSDEQAVAVVEPGGDKGGMSFSASATVREGQSLEMF